MTDVVTPEFLSHIKALYPASSSGGDNTWAFVAAVAFSASNLSEAVPLVFQHAASSTTDDEDSLLLVRKMKDAVFKSGLLSGYPKAINALVALHNALPENLRDKKPLRDLSMSTEALTKVGSELFNQTYGDTAKTVQTSIDDAYPDLWFFSAAFGYGYVYSCSEVLSLADTEFAMIAALIPTDTPRQIDWHLHGAIRNGADILEVKAVRQIAIEVAQLAGIKWKNEIPDI